MPNKKAYVKIRKKIKKLSESHIKRPSNEQIKKLSILLPVAFIIIFSYYQKNKLRSESDQGDGFSFSGYSGRQSANSYQNNTLHKASTIEFSSRLEIGGDYTHVNLKPHGSPSFHGNLGGAQGKYEYRPGNNIYGAAKLAWKQGHTTGSAGKRSLTYIDAQERLGYTFETQGKKWLFTLFTGFGYRYMRQHLKPKTGDSTRYRYNEFYVPLGFISDYAVSTWFNLGLGFTWMPQVFPTVSISHFKGDNWTLTNTLNNYFVQLPLDFTVTKNRRFHIIVNPFYERWEDGHSTSETSEGTFLGLPGNTYNFWGADVNFGYRF